MVHDRRRARCEDREGSMAAGDEQRVREALAALGLLAAGNRAPLPIARLPGLTNRVYKVETESGPVCVRIPGPGTAEIIDRRAEATHAHAAAALGIAPEVLLFESDGLMVTRFVDGASMAPDHFKAGSGTIERAATALNRLHAEARGFTRSFDLFGTIDRYVSLLSRQGAELPAHLEAVLAGAARIRQALQVRPTEEKPCHCDPTGGNLIDTGARVLLIDWEYSALNEPMWDLAYLSLEAEFDVAMDERLLSAYLGRPSTENETWRMVVHKPLCDLLSGLWALIQQASGNRAADFQAYAARRLNRARMLMRRGEAA
jgi:thiamine kinase-like enzyme